MQKIAFENACNIGKWSWRSLIVAGNGTLYYWSVITMWLTCTISEILPVLLSVCDCLWPWEVLHFKDDSWNCRPCMLSDIFVNIVVNAAFPVHWQLEWSPTAKVTFKVTQGHWCWCHSIGHIWFPISLQSCTISSTNVPLHILKTSSHSASVNPSAVNYGQQQRGWLSSFEQERSLVVAPFQSADQTSGTASLST